MAGSSSSGPPLARSPVSDGPSMHFHFLEPHMQAASLLEDRSLPPTPRSPSPTCSPPSSPKRQRNDEQSAVDSAAEDDLELRAAALGLNEVTQRVWRETALPPTPSSPSPTFSPPSSPKGGATDPTTAQQAAAKLAESLRAVREGRSSAEPGRSADSASDSEMGMDADPRADAIAAWEADRDKEGGSSVAAAARSGKRRGR